MMKRCANRNSAEIHRHMETFTMNNLYQNIYESNPPIIEGLLNEGTHLFVGAPKFGKSFFVAQIAYHVSMGTFVFQY